MEERKLNKSKVIINIIAVLLVIALIVVLTKVLTNKKQATTVSTDVAEASTNTQTMQSEQNTASNQDNNVWAIGNNSTNTSSQTQNNTNNNNVAVNQNVSNTTNETKTENKNENTNTESKTSNDDSTNSEKSTNKENSVNGVIWLTFDDGPSSNITPKVLDILKEENIKATFFIINYTQGNEHLIKRIVDEGHTIGIHGYSHEYSKIYKSKETFMNNVYTLQDRIYKTTGVKSMYTRFPGGSSNTVSRKYCKGIMTELTKEMLAKGFKYYDWNISSGDAGGAKNATDVYNNVTKNLSKKRGNMVLMHDFGSNKKGLEALPKIIEYAKKEGYTFAKIDDNTPMYAQHVNN